jgi:hypothetical protein
MNLFQQTARSPFESDAEGASDHAGRQQESRLAAGGGIANIDEQCRDELLFGAIRELAGAFAGWHQIRKDQRVMGGNYTQKIRLIGSLVAVFRARMSRTWP